MHQLLQNVLEHVPRRHIGPLHLVEDKNERAMLGDVADVLRHLVQKAVFAPHRESVGDTSPRRWERGDAARATAQPGMREAMK